MDWKEEVQRIVSSYDGKYELQDCYFRDLIYHYIIKMNFKPYITTQSMVSPAILGDTKAQQNGNILYITGTLNGLKFILDQYAKDA